MGGLFVLIIVINRIISYIDSVGAISCIAFLILNMTFSIDFLTLKQIYVSSQA